MSKQNFFDDIQKEWEDIIENRVKRMISEMGFTEEEKAGFIELFHKYKETGITPEELKAQGIPINETNKYGIPALTDIDAYSKLAKHLSVKNEKEITPKLINKYFNKPPNYLKSLDKIKDSYKKSKNWDNVLAEAVINEKSTEAFIDYVEEVYQTTIKTAKKLQRLTKVQEKTIEELETIITNAKYTRYYNSLVTALENGASYHELLKIAPRNFELKLNWDGCITSDKYTSILRAISQVFLFTAPLDLDSRPNLRSIADEIESRYSVVMDAYDFVKNY